MQLFKLKDSGDVSVFFQALAGFAIAALVMLGVGGTVYKALAPEGWMSQLVGSSVAGGLAAVLALCTIGAFAWMTREWTSARRRGRLSELLVYSFAAAGALYVVQLLLKGAL
jgi:F0F1-type ATP synthase assembly protein I